MADPEWSLGALADLDSIADHISSSVPGYGPVFVRRIVQAAERLAQFPRMGREVPEVSLEDYREIVFQNYRIVYRLKEDRAVILGVWHGAIDLGPRLTERLWDVT